MSFCRCACVRCGRPSILISHVFLRRYAGISGDLADVVMVLSRLVVASTHHTSQFMAANGPAVLLKAGFLDFKPGSMDQSLFDTLAIFVHVARNSDANVRALLCQDTGGHFDTDQGTTPNSPLMEILNCLLIHHPSVAIHELVCKLLGNMFRHSDQCHEAALRSPESPAILGSLVHQLEVRFLSHWLRGFEHASWSQRGEASFETMSMPLFRACAGPWPVAGYSGSKCLRSSRKCCFSRRSTDHSGTLSTGRRESSCSRSEGTIDSWRHVQRFLFRKCLLH